jgi:hypothetical protein
MIDYTPAYDTTIRTSTVVERHPTEHRDGIDWAYPFDDPEHTACMCCGDAGKREYIEKCKEWLRQLELGEAKAASDYGGWPRLYKPVLWVGMASCWPYWKPRPTVIVSGTLGPEYIDWRSLTGVSP